MLIHSPTKEVRSWTTDSRRWARYSPRPGDIVIATAPKCGTTWMQQIVSLLVFLSPEPREIQNTSPWIDFRLPPLDAVMGTIAAQEHRRFLKSHLPYDAMPIHDDVSYIHVARHGLDSFMSWHNHARNYSAFAREQQSAAGMADETVARPLPVLPESPADYFDIWMTEGAEGRQLNDYPSSLYFDLERSYWAARKTPNLLMVHYNDLKSDLGGEMRRIAAFLGMEVPQSVWAALIEAADFEFMRKNGATLLPRAATSWDKGHERFINQGTNERWRAVLSDAQIARYETRVASECSSSLAAWLEGGRHGAGDPRSAAD